MTYNPKPYNPNPPLYNPSDVTAELSPNLGDERGQAAAV